MTKFSKEHKAEIVAMYVGGLTAEEVHNKTGHARRTITRWVEQFGYPVFLETDRVKDSDGMRTCIRCDKRQSLVDDFYHNATSGQVSWVCKDCTKLKRRSHYETHQEEIKESSRLSRKNNPRRHREYDMKKRFKIGYPEFEDRFDKQGRVCAGCGAAESGMKSGEWSIDHDHSCCPYAPHGTKTCGKCIRGILCRACNTTLGNAQDNVERLLGLAEYLKNYQSQPQTL